MSNKFTPIQEKAIDIDGSNVLVSAGAGSGKTAVLTERVYRLIAEKSISLDSILVLTFTNAAAREMKERIRKKLAANPLTQAVAEDIDSSYIMTFDAYALYLVKKYHLDIGVDQNIDIADQSLFTIEKHRIIDDVFCRHYQNPDLQFLNLIKKYCYKNDHDLKELILSILDASNLLINPDKMLLQYEDNYLSAGFFEDNYGQYSRIFAKRIELLDDMTNYLQSPNEASRINDYIKTNFINGSKEEIIRRILNLPSFPRKQKDTDASDENIRNQQKDLIKKIKAMAPLLIKADSKEDFLSTKEEKITLIKLANEVNRRLEEFKQKYGLYDFSSIARLALKVLDNPAISEEIRSSLKYIMVDEYQDTSDIQEAVLNRIANNNLYMVGDVKQSIYRFRNANSKIFSDKYMTYGKGVDGHRIDMNKNFRSRREVLEDINQMFSSLMTLEYGGADYRDSHLIEFGNLNYDNQGSVDQNCHTEIIPYDNKKMLSSDRVEYEIRIIASDIASKISGNYQVMDKSTGQKRSISLEDFAILVDRKRDFSLFKKIFDEYQLPLRIEQDEGMASSDVIMAFHSLCLLVDSIGDDVNYDEVTKKHAFLSLSRSYIINDSDETIYRVIKDNTWANSNLMQRINSYKTINSLPLNQLLSRLLIDFEVYDRLILIGDIQANIAKLDSLVALSKTLATIGFTLHDFVNYFSYMDDYGVDLSVNASENLNDAVNLMTIHKSKGLEFPIVYFPHLFNRFNRTDVGDKDIVNPDLGIIIPNGTRKNGQNMFKDLLKYREIKEDISEKIRLFYVALTRAREKIIILHGTEEKSVYAIEDATSLDDFITLLPNKESYYVSSDKNINPPSKREIKTMDDSEQLLKIHALDFSFAQKEDRQISKVMASPVEDRLLVMGERLHHLLEMSDFINKKVPAYSTESETKIITKVLNLPLFDGVTASNLYREYPFFDKATEHEGIIDGFIVEKDTITLFDYKLKHFDDVAYARQLRIYADYLKTVFQKPVRAYLISIFDGIYRPVDI
ncbi:MAG TPA: UvrD-helicase domain-containing protein [Bacilli bacterium]|nr:UvrD-helicase domain-containing protein [Bacilli bacterium]